MKTYLECDHCGYDAVESDEDGCFQEDSVEKCMTCGIAGHIDIDWNDDDEDNIATFLMDIDPENKCDDWEECEECHPRESLVKEIKELKKKIAMLEDVK